MRSRIGTRIVFLTLLMLVPFLLSGQTRNVAGLEDPDYIERVEPGYVLSIHQYVTYLEVWNIEFEVTSGGNKEINVYVMSEDNYQKFMDGKSFSYYRFFQRYTSGAFSFEPLVSDTYYLVFDNSITLVYAKTVEIKSEIKWKSSNTQDTPDMIMINGFPFVFLGAFSILGVVALLVPWLVKGRKGKAS